MMKRNNIIIELYQMPEPELSNVKQRTSGRIDHIAFNVDDIGETFALLKNEGLLFRNINLFTLTFGKKDAGIFTL